MDKLYAFWGYDLFPYYLGSEITKINNNGDVYANSYQGWFKPKMILPLEKGLELKKKLDEIEKQYKDEKCLLDNKSRKAVEDLFNKENLARLA